MKEYFIGIRLTYSEYHRLGALSRKSGKNRSEIVRELLNNGFIKERIKREHIYIIRELVGESTNLNQLAKKANTFGYTDASKEVAELASKIKGIIKKIKDDS